MPGLKYFLTRITIVSLAFLIGCTAGTEVVVQKQHLKPLQIFPAFQNGYGSGMDQLAQPDDVEIQKNGNVIITDVDNNRIQYFNQVGKLLCSIDTSTLGLKDVEIIPTGISSDGQGFIYVTMEGIGRIARFTEEMKFDQFIGRQGKITAEQYYLPENDGVLIKPQGIIVSESGDVFVIDMAKKVFKKEGVRNFGFRKFKKVQKADSTYFVYDKDFAASQEITTIMRKSEGMAISEERNLLLIAEEKPSKDQFGNSQKMRYIGVFDLTTGKFKNRLIGVTLADGQIIDGTTDESIEGLSVFSDYLFAVAEKAGRVDCYDIDTGERLTHFGSRAPFYCDDESDCISDGVNYNEQSIIAGTAQVHLLNNWRKNELASPDGVCSIQLDNGQNRLAVVDQWNSRILMYDLDDVLKQK
ncbi:MAG: hypothetical protein U9Q77_10375 [Candidatus Marinimicrobia bacterium]|nr:hypothetical protein [Candidatus Neomarinimicrobiota bacterium]